LHPVSGTIIAFSGKKVPADEKNSRKKEKWYQLYTPLIYE